MSSAGDAGTAAPESLGPVSVVWAHSRTRVTSGTPHAGRSWGLCTAAGAGESRFWHQSSSGWGSGHLQQGDHRGRAEQSCAVRPSWATTPRQEGGIRVHLCAVGGASRAGASVSGQPWSQGRCRLWVLRGAWPSIVCSVASPLCGMAQLPSPTPISTRLDSRGGLGLQRHTPWVGRPRATRAARMVSVAGKNTPPTPNAHTSAAG